MSGVHLNLNDVKIKNITIVVTIVVVVVVVVAKTTFDLKVEHVTRRGQTPLDLL